MEAKVVRLGEGYAVRLSADELHSLGVSEGETVELQARRKPGPTLDELIVEMDRLGTSYRPEIVDWGPDIGAEVIDDGDGR